MRIRLLGCDFEFDCDSAGLQRIVAAAYANLPRHKLSAVVPQVRIHLMLAPRAGKQSQGEVARIEMFSGADFLGATTSTSDFVVLSAQRRTGLIVASEKMLQSAYHVRYELLEFSVFTLAARVQGLISLHSACVGRRGRGLLLMGPSGAGKSTAALHCLLRGLEFLSEDSVFVTPDSLLATAVPNFLHVRRDGLRFVPESSAALIRGSPVIKRRSGVEKFEMDLRQPEFHLARRPLKIVACVFMSAEAAVGTRTLATPLRRSELLARLSAEQPYPANQAGWKPFCDNIADVPAFELRRGGHPTDTVAALEEILTETARH